MSKEKLSAVKDAAWKWLADNGHEKPDQYVHTNEFWMMCQFATDYTEQLQREREEMRRHLAIMAEEFSHPDYEIWCDHEVGICCCDQIEMLEKAERLGNMITPKPEK